MVDIEHTELKGCFLLKPKVFTDHRGTFMETFSQRRFEEITGKEIHFVQDNQSSSTRGVLRGLHFQKDPYWQAKLVRCILGEIIDVVVDLRKNSPTYKKVYKVLLSGENQYQLFVPAGFAHGFITISERSIFSYKCDKYYESGADSGILWNDPELNIDWEVPYEELILSEKDKNLPLLRDMEL